jgi:hypothetical protein
MKTVKTKLNIAQFPKSSNKLVFRHVYTAKPTVYMPIEVYIH